MFNTQFLSLYRRFISSGKDSEPVKSAYNCIVNLKLAEACALVEKLKADFNISPIIQNTSVAPNVMDATKSEAIQESKSVYSVVLQKIDTTNKAKIIREIKAILPNLNLVEAKTFVESAPKLLKDKVKMEEANAIKETLEALGAQIALE